MADKFYRNNFQPDLVVRDEALIVVLPDRSQYIIWMVINGVARGVSVARLACRGAYLYVEVSIVSF